MINYRSNHQWKAKPDNRKENDMKENENKEMK